MVFSGIPFLYYFLPLTLIAYFVSPRRVKNYVLLVASLVFYAWGGPFYALLMVVTIIVGYSGGRWIESCRGTKGAKAIMIVCAVLFLGALGYFKYADFFISNVNAITGLSIPLLRVVLPVGISFYTFQVLSYVVDVYRGTVKAQRNFFDLALYITMFPQLIAGPIVRYTDVEHDLTERTHTMAKISYGIRRFAVGLGKKVLIANVMGELTAAFTATSDDSTMYTWLYAVAFMLQIYFDFSAYSDMAIGLGSIFGFSFPENFNHPYMSRSVAEFWRRWHMTLGTWFRDYVYIPLGGNRVSLGRWLLNILIVWMLTGMWHGAAWNFILWGLMFAVLLAFERTPVGKAITRVPVLSRVYVLLMILISFVLFNAASLAEAGAQIAALFGGGNLPLVSAEALYYAKSYAVPLIIGVIGATPLPKAVFGWCERRAPRVVGVIEPLAIVALIAVCTAFLVDGSFNPFLYFRF